MNRIGRNINIIFKAEKLIASRRMAVMRQQTVTMVAAGAVGGVGLLFLSVSAFFALSEHMSYAFAALIVAGADIILAALLVLFAQRQRVETEIAAVTEVRDLALEDLELEIQGATDEFRQLAQSIGRFSRDPLAAAAPNIVNALLTVLLRTLRKRSK